MFKKREAGFSKPIRVSPDVETMILRVMEEMGFNSRGTALRYILNEYFTKRGEVDYLVGIGAAVIKPKDETPAWSRDDDSDEPSKFKMNADGKFVPITDDEDDPVPLIEMTDDLRKQMEERMRKKNEIPD